MRLPKSIQDNLRFLIAEVGSQVASLQTYIDTPAEIVAQQILDRSGYANNLKVHIHNSSLSQLARCAEGDPSTLSLSAAESIAVNLERITELCRDCIQQMAYRKHNSYLLAADFTPLLKRVSAGIELVESAIERNDTALALKIGHVEHKLNRGYYKLRKRYTASLQKKRHAEDIISALLVAHSVEHMGEALLKISETIISVNLGQPVNINRYYSLMESVNKLEVSEKLNSLTVEHVANTRSGSAVSGICKAKKKRRSPVAIFKDGHKRKLKEEREGVENWHEIYPGLAPKILSYHKRGKSASMLIEHLAGMTFEKILLHESQHLLDETLGALSKTLKSVWHETRGKKKIAAGYMEQLEKRLPKIYKIHPEFKQSDGTVCGLTIPSFDLLLSRSKAYEARLKIPFSVYIHGDFNVDNIIYDPLSKRINFIDLHRSQYMDYVQDVSVFMVSNYRLQILDAPLRRRILGVARDFYLFAAKYAKTNKDHTFELRLALGLARSFATSTRFILDKSLARALMLRARYLLERVLETDPNKAASFRLPIEEIFVG